MDCGAGLFLVEKALPSVTLTVLFPGSKTVGNFDLHDL